MNSTHNCYESVAPSPIEKLEIGETGECTMYSFEQKHYDTIFKYYDKYTWCRKTKTDHYFHLFRDPKSAALYVRNGCE